MKASQAFDEFLQDAADLQAGLLDNASVTGAIATPVTEYPEISVMIDFLSESFDKAPVDIDLKALSVNGEVKEEPMNDYLSSKHLPSSGLKEVLKSPANFFYYLNNRSIIFEESKPYFELGTFAHMAFLEPELFDLVKVEPDFNLATLKGCNDMFNFYEQLNSKEPKTLADGLKLAEIKEAAREAKSKCKYMMVQAEHALIIQLLKRNYEMYAGGIIPRLLKGAKSEISFYGTDEQTGLKLKVRPDAFNIAENIGVNAVISFKTTRAENLEKFMYDAARLQYNLSEGYYQDTMTNITGRKFDVTIMVVLQTVPPFQPAVIWFQPEDLQNGKYKSRFALDLIKSCMDSGKYPGFESLAEQGNFGIIGAKFPQWSHKLLNPVDLDN